MHNVYYKLYSNTTHFSDYTEKLGNDESESMFEELDKYDNILDFEYDSMYDDDVQHTLLDMDTQMVVNKIHNENNVSNKITTSMYSK